MYRKQTVVISVPLSIENNQKLYELAVKYASKSKTQLAKMLLEQAIEKQYDTERPLKNGTE